MIRGGMSRVLMAARNPSGLYVDFKAVFNEELRRDFQAAETVNCAALEIDRRRFVKIFGGATDLADGGVQGIKESQFPWHKECLHISP